MTEGLIMKHPHLEMLASLLVAILCQQHVQGVEIVKTSLWKQSSNRILPTTSEIPVRSQFQCAHVCLTNIRCHRFCHNSVTRTCHVDDVMSGKGQVSLEGTTCFDKIREDCPGSEGYNLYSSRCLKLHPTPTKFLSAAEECALEGGHLYYFKTLGLDQPPLQSLIPYNLTVWVGADAVGRDREFAWHDGTPLLLTSEVWGRGEPISFNNGNDECVSTTHFRATVTRCTVVLPFVCETEL